MNCDKYLDLISARLDGELTARENADLTAHLQACPACRAIASDMEGLHSVLFSVGEVDAPKELSETVLTKIKLEKRPNRRPLRQLATIAACLVLCVGVLRVADAAHSELTRSSDSPADNVFSFVARSETALADQAAPAEAAGQTAPTPARFVADDAKFKSLPFSIDAYPLSQTAISVVPSAHLLDSVDGLARFLARFPNDDLSLAKTTYDEDFFLANRLLAVVLQEPSSSITHTISELTADHVAILRDVSVIGDSDHPRWLLLVPTQLDGPERTLTIELIDQ